MPLSEHEQRMLDQMEQALSAEDPKFASSMRSGRSPQRSRVLLAVLGMVAGVGVAGAGVAGGQVWLGVLGFVLMVAVAAWAFGPAPRTGGALGSVQSDGSVRTHRPARPRRRAPGSFMQRLEQRWERRKHNQQW